MRISDWSSDVCSSDLWSWPPVPPPAAATAAVGAGSAYGRLPPWSGRSPALVGLERRLDCPSDSSLMSARTSASRRRLAMKQQRLPVQNAQSGAMFPAWPAGHSALADVGDHETAARPAR